MTLKYVDGVPRYKHPLYRVWRNMLTRVDRDPYYKDVTVCQRWEDNFRAFVEDMKATWFPGATLDRKDNNKGYSPENCKWATYTEQTRNRRPRCVAAD